MKLNSVLLALILAAVASPLAHSQTKPSPTPALVAPASTVAMLPTLEQWQDEQIKSAATDFQLAQAAVVTAQANVETAKQKLLQVVNEVGVARKLDPKTSQFNFQTLQFKTHPAPVAAPAHQNLKDKH